MTHTRVDFHLYLITDRTKTHGRPLIAALETAAAAGVRAVQVREKDLTPRELYALAIEARDALPGVRVLINDRADIACAARLAGVHLTTTSLSPQAARCCVPDAVLGVSTHTLAEARFAEAMGADFITFGPVYATPSKAAYGAPRGLDALREVCEHLCIPVFALGGVTPDRVSACRAAGAHGVAAISALLDVDDIASAVGEFLAALGESS